MAEPAVQVLDAEVAQASAGAVTRANAGGAARQDTITLPLRVHLLASENRDIDTAKVLRNSDVQARLDDINRVFRPAGIEWTIEQVVTEAPREEQSWNQSLRKQVKPREALKGLVRAGDQLSPRGFDAYVIRALGRQGMGGAYMCSRTASDAGGIFVSANSKGGRPQPNRKWAHEFGHALGLPHTRCTPEHAGRLMMSGNCQHARPEREGFTAAEIKAMREQAREGRPAPCGKGREHGPLD